MSLVTPGFYSGIGSRSTPADILSFMEEIAEILCRRGWTLRSGAAKGADQAFMKGANRVNEQLVEVYQPWKSYEELSIRPGNTRYTKPSDMALENVSLYHPAPRRLSDAAVKLHARNENIIRGMITKSLLMEASFGNTTLPLISSVVICWTEGGALLGGTAQGIRVANHWGVTVVNLGIPAHLEIMKKKMRDLS